MSIGRAGSKWRTVFDVELRTSPARIIVHYRRHACCIKYKNGIVLQMRLCLNSKTAIKYCVGRPTGVVNVAGKRARCTLRRCPEKIVWIDVVVESLPVTIRCIRRKYVGTLALSVQSIRILIPVLWVGGSLYLCSIFICSKIMNVLVVFSFVSLLWLHHFYNRANNWPLLSRSYNSMLHCQNFLPVWRYSVYLDILPGLDYLSKHPQYIG